MRLLISLIIGLSLTAAAFAQEAEQPETVPAPEPPPIPDQVESGEPIEPEVVIKPWEKGKIEEYRINGQLYMVKFVPTRGKPYYLIDTDGDGDLETRRDELGPSPIPQWIIFSW